MVQSASQEDCIVSVDEMFRKKQKRVTSSIWHKYPVGGLQDIFTTNVQALFDQ
jgi:hypothetical protein